MSTKLFKASWALLKFRSIVNIAVVKKVYHSFVYSHLHYCITILGLTSEKVLYSIIKLHKIIVRIITAPYRTSTTPQFLKQNFLKIKEIYDLGVSKSMYELYNLKIIHCYFLKQTIEVCKYNTR